MNSPDGITRSEQYLKKLCDKSFLSLWSHANVYRDQWIDGTKTQGKEVCDLLVVFGNRIIIVSDKYCAFPESGNLEVDWRRWYKRAVLESSKQLRGAERWLRQYPSRLFADPACTVPLSTPMPDTSEVTFHRVIVAHGAAERCIKEMGGSGSLMLDFVGGRLQNNGFRSDILGPFTISEVGNGKDIVHVFDDNTAGLILRKLDTISDFVAYMDKKEKLLNSGMSVLAGGEEDLLAYYLWHMTEHDEHDFIFETPVVAVYIEEGTWHAFSQSDQRAEQFKADRVSYLWDEVIETFASDCRESFSIGRIEVRPSDSEQVLRVLASENRFRRRQLANSLLNVMDVKKPRTDRFASVICPSRPEHHYYVFMGLVQPEFISDEVYRDSRVEMLALYCEVVKLQYTSAQLVVGIATELGNARRRSFDAVLVDTTKFTDADMTRIKQNAIDLKMLRNVRERHVSNLEYPESLNLNLRKGRFRIVPCKCGSGLKHKHCCGGGYSHPLT